MANLIQIKRSLTTATAPSLANGELAFTANGDHLFIGSNGASITIAGKFNPGVLTANQALVANGTGFLDAVKTANLTVQSITANGVSSPGANYLLAVDAGGNTFWQPAGAVSINTDAQYSWTNTQTFNANVTIAGTAGLIANGGIGSAGQVLHSNGTSVYWSNTLADITSVVAGDGLTGGGTTGDVTLNIGQGNGISVSADSIRVQQANGIAVDAGGVRVDGGSTLTVNNSGVHVNTNLSLTTLAVSGNATISGDLTVVGNVTTVNVSSLSVSDPLIKLAVNNTVSDQLWLGFTGHFNGEGNTTNHAGMARSPDNKEFYVFGTYGDETLLTNENKVNTADPSFSLANVHLYVKSGGLVTNATHVAITANSTVNVSITANSLTLATPLAVTSGGLGLSSITAGAILVGNGSGTATVLAAGTDGYVLQSNGTSVVYGTLDGGTF